MADRRDAAAALERLVALLLGAAILLFAFGSSSDPDLLRIGSKGRWLALAALGLAAALLAWKERLHGLTGIERRVGALAGVATALCLLSAAWSVDPALTVARAGTVLVLFATTYLLAFSAARRPGFAVRVLRAGTLAIALVLAGGFLLAFIRPTEAVQAAPARFQGLGENPDTVPLLAALGLPLAIWLLYEARERRTRFLAAAVVVLIAVTVPASGSRGAFGAGLLGAIVVTTAAAASRRGALFGAALVVAGAIVSLVFVALPARVPGAEAAVLTAKAGVPWSPGITPAAERVPSPGPLADELGRPTTAATGAPAHSLLSLSSSGRVEGWIGAIHQGNQRPLLGYGFGTEARVFVDRFYTLESDLPEESWIGLYLQLGLAGVFAFAALLLFAGVRGMRGLRRLPRPERLPVAACAGVVLAGLVQMFFQSYIYSVGNIATLTFWTCLFFLAVGGARGFGRGRS